MADINLHVNTAANATYVSNTFIDYYMKEANGEYVKIYLYILRALSQSPMDFSIASMADALGHTQLDVRRALTYWESQGLLSVRCDSMGEVCDICINDPGTGAMAFSVSPVRGATPAPVLPAVNALSAPVGPVAAGSAITAPAVTSVAASVPMTAALLSAPAASMADNIIPIEPHTYNPAELDSFGDNRDVKEIIFIAERYLGRALTPGDMNCLLYWYDGLDMSVDLIENLIAHCVDLGKTTMSYINKVAIAWASDGIHNTDEAEVRNRTHSAESTVVMKSMGISGRSLTPVESDFVNKWFHEWSFSADMVEEACNRTILATGKPHFPYADSILKDWHENGVCTRIQLPDADTRRRKKYETAPKKHPQNTNKFHNYKEAPYDFTSIESQLLKQKY